METDVSASKPSITTFTVINSQHSQHSYLNSVIHIQNEV